MRLNDSLFNLVELKRNLERDERHAAPSRAALQRIASGTSYSPQRPRTKSFVGALLTHNARARRAAQPIAGILLDVRSPDGRLAVHVSFGPADTVLFSAAE